ncbi:MAG TPA: class I SAM-dependent methyltransferase [Pirellulales bacterium]|nr:class I SAM-dependent methyltransferase [Pirellulales bacterium]
MRIGSPFPTPRSCDEAAIFADDAEKQEFYERMPALPVPLDRGRLAKQWLPDRAELLDIGCGAGYHVRHLARKAKRVVAIDVDRVALRVARRRVRSSRVTFLHYDGATLPFADGSFDAITLLDVLEHVPDRAGLVAEIARVLRPGGLWTVSVPYRGALRWLSPENMASDYPRLYRALSAATPVRFWVRGHNATGQRHHHFSAADLAALAEGQFVAQRTARRGSLLYGAGYLGLCFPPPLLGRVWASLCYALMALDYQVASGPLAYNLAMQFRKLEYQPAEAILDPHAASVEQPAVKRARAA